MNVLVSVGTGSYVSEIHRCAPSIKKWWPWSVMTWRDQFPPGSPNQSEQPYAFKAFAAKWAFENGFQTVTWIDSIIHLSGSPERYITHLNNKGYFFQDNGFNCAQTCSDRMLSHYSITRDKAETIVEVVGGCWGLHVRNRDFVEELCENSKLGLFSGSRGKDPNDSIDSRFLFCRHDQSLMSLMLHNRGWTPSSNDSDSAFFSYGSHLADRCFVIDRSFGAIT